MNRDGQQDYGVLFAHEEGKGLALDGGCEI
jgi:hypothetical protein